MQFCFLPELNTYIFENGESFLDRMMRLKAEKATMQEIEAAQIQAIKAAIDSKMGEYIYENNSH
jgi:ribosomal protein L31E